MSNPPAQVSITVALTLKLTGAPGSGLRLAYRWGSAESGQSWLLTCEDTDEIALVVHTGTSGFKYYQRKTTGLNLTNGNTYSIVARWKGSGVGGPEIKIWVNGVERTLVNGFQVDAFATYTNSASTPGIGRESVVNVDGLDGDYAEWATWGVALSDAACLDLSNARLPSCYPDDLWLYLRALTTLDTVVTGAGAGGASVIYTSASDASHPTMIACGAGGGGGASGAVRHLMLGRRRGRRA